MTQERYQEAAEYYAARAKQGRRYASHGPSAHLQITEREIARVIEHAERDELAAEVLAKLASGWVLVPEEPTPEILQAMHDGPLCASEYQMDEKAKAWLIDMYNAAIAAAPKP
jgi:hypothetical protein